MRTMGKVGGMGDFKKWVREILVMGDDFEMCECLGGVKGKGGGGRWYPFTDYVIFLDRQ